MQLGASPRQEGAGSSQVLGSQDLLPVIGHPMISLGQQCSPNGGGKGERPPAYPTMSVETEAQRQERPVERVCWYMSSYMVPPTLEVV